MNTGDVTSWGDNALGQLGGGDGQGRSAPAEIPDLSGITAIDAGSGHSLAVAEDGTAWGWGRNSFGQLGDGTTTDQRRPARVSGLTDVVKIGGGGGHSAAVRKDGTVWAWGAGFFGALGTGAFGVQPVPVRVKGIENVVDICVGGAHNLALCDDGSLWTWGRDDHGQLGDAGIARPERQLLEYGGYTFPVRPTPVRVEGIHDARTLAAGGGQSLVVLADGTLLSWGFNDFGQLCDGTTTDRPVPTKVEGLPAAVVGVSAAYHHTVLVLADGSVWGCGLNDGGQLGDSSTVNRTALVRAGRLDDVVALATNGGGTDAEPGGGGHTVAVRADGTVWAWGWNNHGQLGVGDTENRSTPVQVPGLSAPRALAAGGEIPPTNKFRAAPVGGFVLALH